MPTLKKQLFEKIKVRPVAETPYTIRQRLDLCDKIRARLVKRVIRNLSIKTDGGAA